MTVAPASTATVPAMALHRKPRRARSASFSWPAGSRAAIAAASHTNGLGGEVYRFHPCLLGFEPSQANPPRATADPCITPAAETRSWVPHALISCLDRSFGGDRLAVPINVAIVCSPSACLKLLGVLEQDAILMGHSIGVTILINVLAERAPERALGGISIIAAPFVGEGGWTSQDIQHRSDLAARLPPGFPIFLYPGCKDEIAPISRVELYPEAIPSAQVRRLIGRDRQLS